MKSTKHMATTTTQTATTLAATNAPKGQKGDAMSSTHNLTTAAKPASERGALDGHSVRCSCGFSASTSLSEREALKLGVAHRDWAIRAGK